MTAPRHSAEHTELMQLLARATEKSETIAYSVLVTVGVDGRPMVGTDLDSPEAVVEVLAQVVGAYSEIEQVTSVDIPKANRDN